MTENQKSVVPTRIAKAILGLRNPAILNELSTTAIADLPENAGGFMVNPRYQHLLDDFIVVPRGDRLSPQESGVFVYRDTAGLLHLFNLDGDTTVGAITAEEIVCPADLHRLTQPAESNDDGTTAPE